MKDLTWCTWLTCFYLLHTWGAVAAIILLPNLPWSVGLKVLCGLWFVFAAVNICLIPATLRYIGCAGWLAVLSSPFFGFLLWRPSTEYLPYIAGVLAAAVLLMRAAIGARQHSLHPALYY